MGPLARIEKATCSVNANAHAKARLSFSLIIQLHENIAHSDYILMVV
jgi:hypothetical protein